MESKKRIPLVFITGNKKKLEEFLSQMETDILEHYNITNVSLDRKRCLLIRQLMNSKGNQNLLHPGKLPWRPSMPRLPSS